MTCSFGLHHFRLDGQRILSGRAVCVMKDDSVLFRKDYGGFTDSTQVYVASAGKWVAAAVVAAVVDTTALDWDDPVEKWLPEFREM